MRLTLRCATIVMALIARAPGAETPATGQQGARTDSVVPIIAIDDVPFSDALKNVARQMNLNYILDPRVPGGTYGVGRLAPEPTVRVRWTNLTLHTALSNLLKEHKLTMVTNPATSVARIAPLYRGVKPVPASQVGTNAGAVIPLMIMEQVSLPEAIRKLAEAAQIDVSLDPNVRLSGLFDPEGTVSIRWEKITARQALAALLDNYDLELIEDPATASPRITLKAQDETRAAGKSEPSGKEP